MRRPRRSFISIIALLASGAAARAHAQYGGRPRDRGDSGATRSARPADVNPRGGVAPLVDPAIAVERELPSLRIDLNLTAGQAALFDSFERPVRNTAEAGRVPARHLSAFRAGEGSAATAADVLGTIVDDDAQRADAARLALERMTSLYAALSPDQRKQFDRRIVQSLRDPLGGS